MEECEGQDVYCSDIVVELKKLLYKHVNRRVKKLAQEDEFFTVESDYTPREEFMIKHFKAILNKIIDDGLMNTNIIFKAILN